MKNLNTPEFAIHRDRQWEERKAGRFGDDKAGCFKIASPDDGKELRLIAVGHEKWDHISVSRADRTPSWAEMDFIYRMFFQPHETAMQLHVPATDHINTHSNCLHIWRPRKVKIPRPPANFV